MPNTKAPMISDGPMGAIAPPKPGTSAATGTMTSAATAISSSAASKSARLALDEEAPPRGREAELGFQERDAEREAADDQRGRGQLPVEHNQRDENGRPQHGRDEERPVEAWKFRGGRFEMLWCS